jgi:CubicO group peptidase (beta-lactamase class C family)
MDRRRFGSHLLASIGLLAACSSESAGPAVQLDDGTSYWPAATWRTARAADAGIDAVRLENLLKRIRSKQYADVHGLVIVKNGYVVAEEYFNGSSAQQVHEMQSVTKSVTSLVMGIAIDQGRFNITDKLLGFFPEYTDIRNLDDRKRAVTLGDALSMRSGIDFYEDPYPGSPLDQLNSSHGDWLRIVLDEPMNAAPGELWQYNSGVVISLGGVIYNSTHLNADDFARQNLFDPIGVGQTFWYKGQPNDLPHMGGGLNLRAMDLARIGYLVLRKGRWGDRQIVSEQWIASSTSHVVRNPRTFGSHPTDYGYLWWLMPLDGSRSDGWDSDIITASGAKGQWLFIVPKYDMVVAVTSGGTTFNGYIDPVNFLYSEILPAVISRE